MPPTLDYGDDCPPHLKMIMNNSLGLYGYDAVVYRKVIIENIYSTIEPEYTINPVPVGRCKVFTSQPMEGFIMSDYIRLSDVTTEVTLTTLAKLDMGDQLVITTPDKNTFNLRITEALSFSSMSRLKFKYRAVQC